MRKTLHNSKEGPTFGEHGKVVDGGDAGEGLFSVGYVVGGELGVLQVPAQPRGQPKCILFQQIVRTRVTFANARGTLDSARTSVFRDVRATIVTRTTNTT